MDKGHRYADKILEEITDRMLKVFDSVDSQVIKKVKRYLKKFEQEIKEHERMVDDGEITEREFEQWFADRVMLGKEWEQLRDEVSEDYHKATVKAMELAGLGLMAVYSFNKSFANQSIAKQVHKYFNQSLPPFDDKPRRPKRILPRSPDPVKNLPWHRRKVESVIRSGMKKGHSVDKIARRLHKVTNMDRVSSYRAARTGITCAENEARIDAMIEAQETLGIAYDKIWKATPDNRTRTSHRVINGERVPCEGYFSNNLYEPADPDGDPAEVYNCRCTLEWVPAGIAREVQEGPNGMGKLEWSAQKPVSKPYPKWRDE